MPGIGFLDSVHGQALYDRYSKIFGGGVFGHHDQRNVGQLARWKQKAPNSNMVNPRGTEGEFMVFGYLDPGSGSLILQAVLGGVAGVGVAAKAMRNRWKARKMADTAEDEAGDQAQVNTGSEPSEA
jgi:hypothetical protein